MLILNLKFLIVFSVNYNNNILDKRNISAVQNKCVKVTTMCNIFKVPTCMPCFFDFHSVRLKNKT